MISAYPGLKLEIEGHTDSVGGEAFNQRLSEQRADSVEKYLMQEGLPDQSMTARGFGKSQPIASNRCSLMTRRSWHPAEPAPVRRYRPAGGCGGRC